MSDVVVERTSSFEAVRDDWDRLAIANRNVFGTFEWASIWWKHFGGGHEPCIARCRSSGNAVALLPLYIWQRSRLRVARLIGHGPADELGPLCVADRRSAAAAGLRQVLRDVGADLLLAEEVPRDDGWSRRLGGRVTGTGPSPLLRFSGGDWDEFLGARSRKFRQEVRARERALLRDGFDYRLCETPEQLGTDLDTLFSLHRLRWPTGSHFTRLEAFHREFARIAFARGWVRLWFLQLEGRAVAATYGFRFGGIELGYQAGRDPAFDRLGVGAALTTHTIRDAMEAGIREFRLGRGGEEYKSRFGGEDPGFETFMLASGLKGRLAVAGAGVARRSAIAKRLIRSGVRT